MECCGWARSSRWLYCAKSSNLCEIHHHDPRANRLWPSPSHVLFSSSLVSRGGSVWLCARVRTNIFVYCNFGAACVLWFYLARRFTFLTGFYFRRIRCCYAQRARCSSKLERMEKECIFAMTKPKGCTEGEKWRLIMVAFVLCRLFGRFFYSRPGTT